MNELSCSGGVCDADACTESVVVVVFHVHNVHCVRAVLFI